MEDLQKEFIPYDRALRLKALGFDEPCFATYHYPSKSLVRVDADSQGVKNSNLVNFTSAPTFSQAFRWFREKYKLGVQATRDGGEWHFNIVDYSNEQESSPQRNLIHVNLSSEDYEEAELACLDKLLGIVESKQKEDE